MLPGRIVLRRALLAVALALAALVGVVAPARRLATAPPLRFGNFPDWADRTFTPLRATVTPGERIGVIIASPDPNAAGGMHYAAQWALIPALVEPIYLVECLRPEHGPRCRLDRVRRVAFAPRDAASLAFIEQRLGLARQGRVGPVFVLERAP